MSYLATYRVQIALLVKEWVPATRPQIEYLLASPEERLLFDCTRNLPPVDAAIIYKLGGDSKFTAYKGVDASFFVGSSGATIEKQVALRDDDAESLAKLWRTREFRDRGSWGSGEAYGIQFFSGGISLVQACLYYDSMSCCLDAHEDWLTLKDRDDALLKELRRRIASVMPTSPE